MKVTGNADAILECLIVGASMVDRKVAQEWSHVVFLETTLDRLWCSSRRLDASVSWSTDKIVVQDIGECAIHPEPLKRALGGFKREVVTLELDEMSDELVVFSADATLTLAIVPGQGRGPKDHDPGALMAKLDGYETSDAIEVASICAHPTGGDVWNAVCIQWDGKSMGVYATDRSMAHGVELVEFKKSKAIPETMSWAIPMEMIKPVLGALTGDATLELYESYVIVRQGENMMTTSLSLEPRPILRTGMLKIAESGQRRWGITVDRKELIEALNRADFVDAKLTRTQLEVTGRTLVVSSIGEGKKLSQTIDAHGHPDGTWTYKLDAMKLRGIVRTLRTPLARLSFQGDKLPLIIEDEIKRDTWQVTIQIGLA